MQRLQFRSAVDIVIVALFIGVAIMVGGAIAGPTSMSASVGALALAVIAGLAAFFAVWWSTSYVLDEVSLHVHCCGVEWHIRIGEIREVEPGVSAISGPALSLYRLEIVYGAMRSVTISPSKEARFLSELEGRRAAA